MFLRDMPYPSMGIDNRALEQPERDQGGGHLASCHCSIEIVDEEDEEEEKSDGVWEVTEDLVEV